MSNSQNTTLIIRLGWCGRLWRAAVGINCGAMSVHWFLKTLSSFGNPWESSEVAAFLELAAISASFLTDAVRGWEA